MIVDCSLMIGCNHFNCDDYIATAKNICWLGSRYKEVIILPMKVNMIIVICKLKRVRGNIEEGKEKEVEGLKQSEEA